MRAIRYPVAFFLEPPTCLAKSDPKHAAACSTAGIDCNDYEATVAEVGANTAIRALRAAKLFNVPIHEWDHWFIVGVPLTANGYCALVHESWGPCGDHAEWHCR